MSFFQRWKRRILFLLCMGAVFGFGFAGLHYSAQHVPGFYLQALDDASLSAESAEQLRDRTEKLLKRIETDPDWSESFTEQQINSWLAHELPELESDWIPKEVSQPRVCLKDGYCLTACRYDGEDFSGVLSMEVRPGITDSEELVLEVISVKAGLIPISLERVYEELSAGTDFPELSFELVADGEQNVLRIAYETSAESLRNLNLKTVAIEEKQIRIGGTGRTEVARNLTQGASASSSVPSLAN